jgi:hypothetical protein
MNYVLFLFIINKSFNIIDIKIYTDAELLKNIGCEFIKTNH